MSYKFFDHTADVLFEAEGKTLGELFEAAALATEETQVELKTISLKKTVKVTIETSDLEALLFNFLQEIIFYKDAKQLVFSKFNIEIKDVNGFYTLKAEMKGEKIDQKKHKLNVDVKAVTLHRFEVKKLKDRWFARVILDI